jgi:hypothetical protein
MYTNGLGFSILAEFVDHAGFDGCILGLPDAPYHIEFTTQRRHVVRRLPIRDDLLVFYVEDRREWDDRCAQMTAAGFRSVTSHNPYWNAAGRTFEDADGCRVVLQNAHWHP